MKTKSDFISTVFLICLLLLVATLPANAQNTSDNNVASINAQGGIAHSYTKHIVIVNNKNNKPIKKVYVGDKVRLKLTNASKIKGIIMSIDSASFVVSNRHVRFDEIMKISTKKGWVQALGGAFIFGGLIMSAAVVGEQVGNSIANSFFGGVDHEESSIEYILPAYALFGVGVAMVLPGYHKIGKI